MNMAAILYHEMGHIIWWVKPIPPGFCSGDDFFITWNPVNRSPGRGFHKFGIEQPGNKPIESYKYSDIFADVQNGNLSRLVKIYSDGNWSSLFGFVAPDEDFIETYKLWTLATRPGSPLLHLFVTIPTDNPSSIDMVSVLNDSRANLFTKGQWINRCVGAP
jgi:hypothetical protein